MSVSEQSVSSSLETTSNPLDPQDSDIFGDSACGEPLLTQRVSLDFTPSDLDNDFIQRKCRAFWDFISSRPELKNLKAVPDPDVYSNVSDTSVSQSHFPSREPTSSHSVTKTAVKMLEFVEEKGLIDRAFEAKLPKSHCEIDHIVSSNESMTEISRAQLNNNKIEMIKQKKYKRQTLPKLRVMCDKMKEWDRSHPKSMKPPGPSPVLPDDIKSMKY